MYPSKETPFFGTFVKIFRERLEDENITFELVVIKGKGTSKLDKIKKYFNFFKNTISKVKVDNYDMIYVHYISHSLLPLLLVQRYIKKPLVLNAHGSDIFVNNRIGGFIQKLVTPIIKKADMIVVPSDYFQDVIYTKFNISKERIFVSPSGGIDTNLFKPQEIKKEIFTIGYVSRIDKGKGWDTLLDAVNSLMSEGVTFRVLIVGGGAEEKSLLKKIEDLELKNIVEFVGPKPHNELVSYFNQMSIFAFTTRLAESLGLVGLEAMACSVPVVGSNIGGLPSYIKDNINGKLFEVGNAEALANNIEHFINMNEKELQMYKNNALKTAVLYDSKIVAKILSSKLKGFIDEK
jgi:glycosyltransferase involved in cell wall biosynthesis